MMSLLWLLTALLGGDPCAPGKEPPRVSVDRARAMIEVAVDYEVPWAICAQEKGGKPPRLRISASDGAGTEVLLDEPLSLPSSLSELTNTFRASVSACRDTAVNRRDKGAVLAGPAGSRHWYNRRVIEIELIAEGPFAPLAFKQQEEVYCRACSDQDTFSFSYYVNDFDKHTSRMVVSLDKARFECARGGGRLVLRRFWMEPGTEQWAPLRPYDVSDHLEERLKPDGDKVSFELIEPYARYCKPGKENMFELVGIDEYATIVRRNYGPSDAIHRASIEFLRCK